MKKVLISLLLIGSALFAQSGKDIYTAKCSSCHQLKGIMDTPEMKKMKTKMQNATPEERKTLQEKITVKMKKSGMRAPAMPMVSLRIKHMTESKKQFITFVNDYIQNPSQKKGYCMPKAYKRFGTMPPIGKGMSEEERLLVATWLYDNFKGTWGKDPESRSCKSKSSKKCGNGKCGSK